MSSPRQAQTNTEAEETGILLAERAQDSDPIQRLTRFAMAVAMLAVVALVGATLAVIALDVSRSTTANVKVEGMVRAEGASCAMSGENCTDAKCCAQPGHRCYRKNENWSSCLSDCMRGKILEGDPEEAPWSCEEFGHFNEEEETEEEKEDAEAALFDAEDYKDKYCPVTGENCTKVRCCAQPGHQCYRKNENWSSCLIDCKKGKVLEGDPDPTPWDCEELGPRAFAGDEDYLYCADRGADCRSHDCCAGASDNCYLKNNEWGSCMMTCDKTGLTKGWDCVKLY